VGKLKDWVLQTSERLGYPIVPSWQLRKYDQSRHLKQLFERLRVNCVLDVGANIGQFREYLRLFLRYHGRVVSFEPIAELHERVAALAADDPVWSTHKMALGETNSTVPINVFTERTLSSILQRDEGALKAMGYEKYLRETELARTEAVPLRRLDTLFDEVVNDRGARVFLKTDTQGYDLNVIRGAAGVLHRIAGMQVEVSIRRVYQNAPTYLEVLSELATHGFEITGMFPVQRDRQLRVVNFDCVMINSRVAATL
jgi:FkbM family methyltransferase